MSSQFMTDGAWTWPLISIYCWS